MKKIMFNDKYGLTQAVLKGRKTMTRRIIDVRVRMINTVTGETLEGEVDFENDRRLILECSKYKVGEEIAIAQSYRDIFKEADKASYRDPRFKKFWDQDSLTTSPGWNNKMFVRADIVPYRIRITNIEVEHLQDISDEDIKKEGVNVMDFGYVPSTMFSNRNPRWLTPIEAFSTLIDKISGRGTWARNPLVYAYEFELIK